MEIYPDITKRITTRVIQILEDPGYVMYVYIRIMTSAKNMSMLAFSHNFITTASLERCPHIPVFIERTVP